MVKPTHEQLPPIAQEALKMFEGVVTDLVAKNPKLAMEEKMANLVAGTDAFKGVAHAMATDKTTEVALQSVGDASKSTTRTV